MKSVYGYLRVSSESQALDGKDGLTRQRTAIKKWCQQSNCRVAKWFEDRVSGTRDLEHREALKDLLTALHADGIRTVIIERLDRLARDLMIQESIVADFKKHGFELISTYEPDLCSDDPTRKLLRQMMGAFYEFERATLVVKLRSARERMRQANPQFREGRKPFGNRPGEKLIIERILQLRAQGKTLHQIAEELNKADLKPRSGVQWWPSSVRQVLNRQKAKRLELEAATKGTEIA